MKKTLITIVILCSSLSLFAQSSPIRDTTLQGLIQRAVQNFPKIKELEEQLRLSDVKSEILKSNYQPTLAADASYRFQAPVPIIEFAGNKVKFQPYHNVAGGFTLNQLVYDFGKTRAQLDKTKSEQAYTQDNIDNTKNAIAYQVAAVYYAILFTDKAIQVQEDQVKTLKENERVITAKIKNGDAIEYDLLNTKVRTSNADNKLKELQGQQENNYTLMHWLTGEDLRGVAVSGDLDDGIQMVNAAGDWKNTNPDAILIKRKMELLALDKQLATINDRPTLFATANAGFRNGFPVNVDQVRPAGYAGLGMSIPILSASRPKLQQKLIDVNLETSRKALTTLESTIGKDLQQVNRNYQTHVEKLENSQLTVETANKAYKLAQTRYKEGLITNTELILVQIEVEEANLNTLQYRYQMLLDKLESHKVVGTKIY